MGERKLKKNIFECGEFKTIYKDFQEFLKNAEEFKQKVEESKTTKEVKQ